MKVIDATGLILGRMATVVAKLALQGEQVAVVNCEKAVISGKRPVVMKRFKEKRAITSQTMKQPRVHREPAKIVKTTIKGMLPKKHWAEQSRGRLAFGRVKCYTGFPAQFKDQKVETIEKAKATQLKTQHSVSIGEVSKLLGYGE